MLRTIVQNKRTPTVLAGRLYSSTWEEVRIPVPWGHIAGKWWGPQDKRPILASHGWQDNSGTFDTLIPLLPKTTSFLAIDFPGCGYSTKLPPGTFYHVMDSVILIRRLVKYFNWQKISFIGHSLGAVTNYVYTMLYPDEVEFLICLDGLAPPAEDSRIIERVRENLDNFLKYDSHSNTKEEPPSYSFQEMEQKLHESLKSVAIDKCKYILTRNIRPSSHDPKKFYFTVDPRWKVFDLLRWSEEELIENAVRLTCPILLSKVETCPFFRKKEQIRRLFDAISQNNKKFEIHNIDGTHHVHLNNPERLESLINQFLTKYDVSDKSHSGLKKENLAIENN